MLPASIRNLALDLSAMRRFEKRPRDQDLTGREGAVRQFAEGRTPSILCLHGFGGVPREVEPLVGVARALGHRVVAPVLAGHGTTPADLAKTRFEDWLAGAKQEFDALRADGPVVIAGLSLGAVVGVALYLTAPADVLGLALLANAFWLRDPFPGSALSLYRRLGLPDLGVWKRRSDLGSEDGLTTHITYGVQPIFAANSVREAGARLREELFRVHCPTLILHGARDSVCPVANAWQAAERMREIEPEVVIFPRSRHILTKDVEQAQVLRTFGDFLGRVGAQKQHRALVGPPSAEKAKPGLSEAGA